MSETPFHGCKFEHCDLPGQCKHEGKCHHPVCKSCQSLSAELTAAQARVKELEKDAERWRYARSIAGWFDNGDDLPAAAIFIDVYDATPDSSELTAEITDAAIDKAMGSMSDKPKADHFPDVRNMAITAEDVLRAIDFDRPTARALFLQYVAQQNGWVKCDYPGSVTLNPGAYSCIDGQWYRLDLPEAPK